jgi:hypothetical protein
MHTTTTLAAVDLAAFEEAIINACAKHERDHRWERDYRRYVVVERAFIKFDSHHSLWPQFQTQTYVSQCAKLDMSAPRVPEVLHFFHRDHQMAYLVMEYIPLIPPPVPDLPQRAARAIQWLRDLPVPAERVRIGPLGSGHARHILFKHCIAPLPFSSIEAVERYLNKCVRGSILEQLPSTNA